jgi:tetratricopeptide (TPR) repeat protein
VLVSKGCRRVTLPATANAVPTKASHQAPNYWAFISYSHRDTRWAEWLHKGLESYHPPKSLVGKETVRGAVPKRISPVFRDREELPSATDLGALLRAALERSNSQIVICSPQAAKSKWVNEEILAFKRLGREDRIFCLIVDGEPNATDMPGRADEECFPPALRFLLRTDGTLSDHRAEPIAADARQGKDGKSRAKLKIIAGVLGVGYDALAQRERQRRNRRLFVIACAAMVGMVITSGLAVYALFQRNAAQRETVRAESEAETARQTTHFLVDLFKISDPSEARGNSVTAREMLDKGAARINTGLASQPAIQATLKDTLGTVYMGLGLYSQARPLLDGALATRQSLKGTEPSALTDSFTHRGWLLMSQAEYKAAEQDYRQVLRLLATQPDDQRTREARAKAQYGLGVVLGYEGNYTEARANLSAALEQQRKIYGDVNEDTAATLKELADAVDQDGDLKSAIPLMQRAVEVQRKLRGSTPHPALAEAINDLASMLEDNNQYDQAEALFSESLAMMRRLYGNKHPYIATALNNLALLSMKKGDLARSEATYREVLAMQRELLGDNHPDVAETLSKIAFVQYESGNQRQGLATLKQSLQMYERLFPGDHPEVARILNREGFWLTLAGNYGAAERDLRTALDMRRRLLDKSHPDIAASLTHLAILEVATGKFTAAAHDAHDAKDIYSAALSPTHWTTAVAAGAEGAALTGLGDYAHAEKLLAASDAILSKDPAALAAYRSLIRGYLATLHTQQQRHVSGAGGNATSSVAKTAGR